MNLEKIDKALQPYEKILLAQERLRRLLGVREVDRPTYEKDIIGPIERFDRRRTAFVSLQPDNPFGEEFRERFKRQTGQPTFATHLPQSRLTPEDRIAAGMEAAGIRLCAEYHPEPLPVTPAEGRVEVDDKVQMSRLVKKAALHFGAELVRITRLDQRWVYKDLEIPHAYAIVVAVSHVRSLNETAPSFLSGVAVSDAYSRLKVITTQLADFICQLGYEARYRETRGPKMEMQMVPIAIDAGLGELARTGRVLSPEFGINMRLKAVTTDLPLEPDKPISFGVRDFCLACENCATYCPANAIPHGPPTDNPPTMHSNSGLRKWYIQADKCLMFWSSRKEKWNTCGGRCIAVCPWNKPVVPTHNLVRWLAIHSPHRVKKMLASADKVLYGRKKSIAS
jgi:reductive dehalogenase